MIHNISICAEVQGRIAISTSLNYGKSSGLTLFRHVFLKTHNPTSLRIIWIILHMIMICSLNQMVYSAEWICENGHCPSRKTSLSKFAHLVSAFSKERLTGKFKNGFFLTLKETLVVKLAQRAIIYIFFDWFP